MLRTMMPEAIVDEVALAPGGEARDRVIELLREQIDALRDAEPGVRVGRDPEEVHKMRTAVRRLRAVLGAVRDMFEPRWLARLRKELDWLGETLGARRDLDVLYEHLRAEVAPLRAGRVAARHMLERLDRQRIRAGERARDAVEGPRYARLLERLRAGAEHPPVVDPDVSLPEVAARAFKKLKKAVEQLPDKPADAELHKVRIRVKRARYAAELAEPMAGKPAQRFIKRAKKLQDALGEHQDAAVAEQRVRRLLRAERKPLAVALSRRLVDKQRTRRQEARAEFLDAWPGLERRGRKAWRNA
ncbi:MAG TPA: CHAD domain-containing protein [Methylomirabilota bacterium]|nr:CHAD domain-containing protein [Methylomirabilota bacterium]